MPHHRRRGKGHLGLHHVQVGVAHAAGAHFDEDLAGARLGDRNLLDVDTARGASRMAAFMVCIGRISRLRARWPLGGPFDALSHDNPRADS